MQNCGFSAQLWNGDGGDMLRDQRQWQLSRTRTIIFRRYDTSPTSKYRRRWPGNPNGWSKVRNLRLFMLARSQLKLHRRLTVSAPQLTVAAPRLMAAAPRQLTAVAPQLPATDGGSSAADGGFRRSLKRHVANIKHIVCDDQATLIVDRNSAICLFTLAKSQLTRRRQLRGWRQPPEIAQTAHCRRQTHRWQWPGSIKFSQLRKLMPTRSSKASRKNLFAVRSPLLRWHCALFFFYYHSQRFMFSPTKNNFSTTLTPTKKLRNTYWRVFFVDSIYSKTIDIVIKRILIFYF